jgi:SAM-dependent methyltransferase
MSTADDVIWHDVECGAYDLDLPLWRELADREGSPVLDVGAGTGRVALDLARRGHEVVALDRDPALLAALRWRAGALPVTTATADAREVDLGRRFPLVIAPMQTLQLLGGREGRARFLARIREHLATGGLLAAALADALDTFDEEHDQPPMPDMIDVDGVVYASRPVAVRDLGDRAAIDRVREIVARDGTRTVSEDVIELDRVDADELAAEAEAFGLRAEPPRRVPQTIEYVGSTVAMLRG